jgi:hypothetical protein
MKGKINPMRTLCCFLFSSLVLFIAPYNTSAQDLAFTTNTYAVGYHPYCVATADVNGDGKLDLVSANGGANTLTVLTNNGSGGFGSNATLNVGPTPNCVVAADINHDGQVDLISADYGNSLTVLTNAGNGVFGSNATLAVCSAPSCVAAADVNGDSQVDLIVPNFIEDTVIIWTNNGSGSFAFNATYHVNPGPRWVAAADVNGDGMMDVVTADYGSIGTLTVLTNNGSGLFQVYVKPYAGTSGTHPVTVTTADVNNDGMMDLISANGISGTITVHTNSGSRTFGLALFSVGNQPYNVAATDINGDGWLDLVSSSYPGNTLTVLTNNGGGDFGFHATLAAGNGARWVAAADVNNDGLPDLVSANYSGSTLTVLTRIPASPRLSITPTNSDSFVLSWASFSTGFVLQTNSDLTTTNWVPAGYTISSDGTNQSTVISPGPGNMFFRLKQ